MPLLGVTYTGSVEGENSQQKTTRRLWPGLVPAAFSSLFFLLSLAFIPHAGIQNDEALFAEPLYSPLIRSFRIRVFHVDIPLMVMTYIGTLKTLLYWPVLALFGGNPWSLRLPVVIVGAFAIYFFYRLTEACVSRTAAVFGALLLATDPVFLLTNTFDWGPVALEHLLLVLACWFLFQFGSRNDNRSRNLSAGFFCLGLALWNKAIFLWALGGLTAATVVVFRRELLKELVWPQIRRAALFFLLGCLPFVLYNIRSRNATLSENAHLDDFATVRAKWIHFEKAMIGDSLFGYMVSEEWADNPREPVSGLGRASAWLRDTLGERRSTYFYYVFLGLLLLVPWWWKRRPARFSLIFIGVTWLGMAVTHDAGGSAHHVILLWPFPVLFAVVTLDALPGKAVALVAAGTALVLLNFSVLNQYFVQFERFGPAGVFTDAIYPLADRLGSDPTLHVYPIDWGVYDALLLMKQGKVDQRTRMDDLGIEQMLADPQAAIVNHVAGKETDPEAGKRVAAAAQVRGLEKQILALVPDSNGRPVFEVYRYHPAP